MKKNNRFIANIIEIVIGIILSVCGGIGILDSYWSGMGTALIIVGCLMLIKQIRYRTNAAYKENVDVEMNDERNKCIRIKAWSWAGYLFVIIGAVCSIVFRISGLNQLSQFSAYCVCVIMVSYWVSYWILRRKY